MVLSTVSPRGGVLGTPLWFVHTAQALYFYSMRSSRKVRNLERESRVSVVVEAGEAVDEIRFAIIAGRAAVVTDPVEVDSATRMLVERYGDGVRLRWGGDRLPDDRCLVRVTATALTARGLK